MSRDAFGLDFGRLAALYRNGILDTAPEARFDRIVWELRVAMAVPLAELVFVDDHRLWAKATAGVSFGETRKAGSFSAFAIEQPGSTILDDTQSVLADIGPDLASTGEGIRAFAGAPVRTRDNHAIGVVYAADRQPRHFGPEDAVRIEQAASAVAGLIEKRGAARLDHGSGAMTRAAFEDMIQRVGALAVRYRRDMSLLVIDVDPFRTLVERFKADLGRLVIERVSMLGRADVRRLDSFGRLSENVFAVLLPETGAAGTRALSRRLIGALAEGWSAPSLGSGEAAIGIGQASLRTGPCQPGELIAKAIEDCRVDTPKTVAIRASNIGAKVA